MSIIEKAAGRIGTSAPRPTPAGGNPDHPEGGSLIENALNKQRGSHQRPCRHPAEPIFNVPDSLRCCTARCSRSI
jgi:hypothetical protein